MKNSNNPVARQSGLVVQEMPDEVLVYDMQSNKAHCLNGSAALVWKSCDGSKSVADIVRDFEATGDKVTEDFVWLAIDQLNENNLLETGMTPRFSICLASAFFLLFAAGASPIAALSNRAIFPYSDLLLHDMGRALDDGYTEGTALTSEWRTPPLWGLGLSKNSQGGEYYLLHGGEGANSSEQYRQLSAAEKQQLITFLESL